MASKKSNYGLVKQYEEEIEVMIAEGKTQKEIADHYGFKDRYVIKEFLKRKRRRQRKIEQGIIIPRQGRPLTLDQKNENEIKRLRMENELLRDFLHVVGREVKPWPGI